MTGENAIKWMKDYLKITDFPMPQYQEALETLIREREETVRVVKIDDAISREAVLKLFATHDGKYLYEAIRDMPSTEQEPKTGQWIKIRVEGFEQWGFLRKCDKCGCVFKFLEISNYCPNCGSMMMESED